jgi:hypothetical protein
MIFYFCLLSLSLGCYPRGRSPIYVIISLSSIHARSRGSAVGIAMGYGLDGRGFPLLHSVQTVSGAHRASYPVGTGICPGVKRPGREANYSPPSGIEVKNGGAIIPLISS